jgi:hypothetical protein
MIPCFKRIQKFPIGDVGSGFINLEIYGIFDAKAEVIKDGISSFADLLADATCFHSNISISGDKLSNRKCIIFCNFALYQMTNPDTIYFQLDCVNSVYAHKTLTGINFYETRRVASKANKEYFIQTTQTMIIDFPVLLSSDRIGLTIGGDAINNNYCIDVSFLVIYLD